MTFGQLTDEIQKRLLECRNIEEEIALRKKEVQVSFDFPIDGRSKKYKINCVTKDGLLLYNDEANRPKGHNKPYDGNTQEFMKQI